MSIRYLQGDCRETLAMLEPGSVQSVITSPPYWGLRDYGTPPLVWGGDPEHAHEWLASEIRHEVGNNSNVRGLSETSRPIGGWDKATADGNQRPAAAGSFCQCGAWLGSLGLEPTPELFIEHIVECFRQVRRVLRDDGTLWLNLGDSYAGSGKGPSNSLQPDASQMSKQTTNAGSLVSVNSGLVPHGTKPKDLLMIPFRVAMALQADGWWLRSVIPWVKRNAMPESVTDRPSTAVEYIFMLSKSSRYFYDADAVRVRPAQPNNDNTPDPLLRHDKRFYWETIPPGHPTANHPDKHHNGLMNGGGRTGSRNRRNSDWFFESLQGLLLDEQDDPLALVVNPAPFSGAHFATFPPKLVEPMVKASTREGDVILDPFGGAGTVGLVADRLGRNAVLCELKDEYASMGATRITDDAPLFADVAAD